MPITVDSGLFRCLWGSQPVDDGLHLAWCEGLASGIIAHFLQLVPEHVVAADECHQVLDCRLWRTVGEVHQSQLFLAVCANDKRFHDFLFIG